MWCFLWICMDVKVKAGQEGYQCFAASKDFLQYTISKAQKWIHHHIKHEFILKAHAACMLHTFTFLKKLKMKTVTQCIFDKSPRSWESKCRVNKAPKRQAEVVVNRTSRSVKSQRSARWVLGKAVIPSEGSDHTLTGLGIKKITQNHTGGEWALGERLGSRMVKIRHELTIPLSDGTGSNQLRLNNTAN